MSDPSDPSGGVTNRGTPPSAGTRVRMRTADRGVQTRVTGVRRIPRHLGGAVLGCIAMIAFFAGLAGDQWPRVLILLALITAVLVLAIWAAIKVPGYERMPQRWRPRRRIEALDLTAWKALAEGLGVPLMARRGLPRIVGGHKGVAVKMEFLRLGGARTVATAALPKPLRARLEVRPRTAELPSRHQVETGDPEFDRAFRVRSKPKLTADRLLTEEARQWIQVVEPNLVLAGARKVVARKTAFVSDPDVLRGLLETVVSIARAES